MTVGLYITPLTIIPWIIYNIAAWIWGVTVWDTVIFAPTLISGQTWAFKVGDLMIVIGIVCLFFEILKSTNSSSRAIINHTLSTIVFIVYLIEFIVVGFAAHSVFFILMVIALFDVIAGFSITIKTARRDLAFGAPGDHTQA